MARIRTIKPQHWSDKELTKISLQAHLLWIALWNFSDDEGVFENDPLLIRSNVFPRRTDVRTEQVSQWLDQLVKARFVIPFTFNGEGYYIHRTFKTHQKIDKPQKSKIPSEIIRGIFDERSTNDQTCRVEESKVKERRVEEPPPENEISDFNHPKNKNENSRSPGAEILYSIEHCLTVAMNDDRWVKNNQATPELLQTFNAYLEGTGVYEKNPMDYKSHFHRWIKKQPHATNQQSSSKPVNRKSAGAVELTEILRSNIANFNGPGSSGN